MSETQAVIAHPDTTATPTPKHSERERGRGRLYTRPESRHIWCEFYVRGRQIRKSTRQTDPKKADRFLKDELDRVSADRIGAKMFVHPKHGTFRTFADRWVRDILSKKKYFTRATEGSRVRTLVRALGNYQVKELCPELVQQFVASIPHPKTARNYTATLRMMWTTAKAWNYSAGDWFEGVTLAEYVKPEAPFFTLDEMRRIITAAVDPFKTFYWLAAETGMRLGELCALQVRALNPDTGKLGIRYSSWHGHVGSTKAKRPREFRLSPGLVRRLSQHIAPVASNPDAFVFRTSNGTAWMGDDVVKRHLKPLLKTLGIKQGVKRVGLHAFRHGNSTLMDSPEVNAPLKVRQDRIGHTEEEMTFLYTHALGAEHEAVAAKLGELLTDPPTPPAERLEDMRPAGTRAM